MRSHARTNVTREPFCDRPIARDLANFTWLLAVVLPGLVLCLRRAAGALKSPLPPAPLIAVALGAVLAATAARSVWLGGRRTGINDWQCRVALALTTLGLFLLGVGLTLPNTALGGKSTLWTLFVVEEAASWWWAIRRHRVFGPRPPRQDASPWARWFDKAPIAGEQLVQRLSRYRTGEGADVQRGSLRADFATGSRSTNVHVAFCPPFARLPQFEFRQSAGPPAQIKLAQILPQGARWEVKLNEPAAGATLVWVEFTATDRQA